MPSCASRRGRAGEAPRGPYIVGGPIRLNGRMKDAMGGMRICGAAASRPEHLATAAAHAGRSKTLTIAGPSGGMGNPEMQTTRWNESRVWPRSSRGSDMCPHNPTSFSCTASSGTAIRLVANSILEMRLALFKAAPRHSQAAKPAWSWPPATHPSPIAAAYWPSGAQNFGEGGALL